jgi:hypothetical protein
MPRRNLRQVDISRELRSFILSRIQMGPVPEIVSTYIKSSKREIERKRERELQRGATTIGGHLIVEGKKGLSLATKRPPVCKGVQS